MAALTLFHDVAVELLECARLSLEENGLPAPCRVCVVPGLIAWDDCSAGGQLVIAMTDTYYATTFPADATEDTSAVLACTPGFPVAVYTMSLMRCAPAPVVAGPTVRAPVCADLQAAALLLSQDSYALRSALICCLSNLQREGVLVDGRLGRLTVVGPEGGCVGVELQIYVGAANG